MKQKNDGAYYTPKSLASFMTEHVFQAFSKNQSLSILEPSCGDGIFFEALDDYLSSDSKKLHTVECVELDKQALNLAKKKSSKAFKKYMFFNQDFFQFSENKKKRYDLIIGNPPYVVRKRLSKETIEKCKAVYQEAGLTEKYFRNLWGAFLISATKLLAENGALAYVLPAELLQVKFTEELRRFLLERFERMEIISFKDIVFKDIEQDTILLFCYKKHTEKGLFFADTKNVEDLVNTAIDFKPRTLSIIQDLKWTSYILSEAELTLLSNLKKCFRPVSNYCTAVAGIVTAANDYFIVDDETVKEYGLEKFILPIIQRGIYINGSAVFTNESLDRLKKNGKACNLLDFNGHDPKSFNKKTQAYLELGEEQNIDQRYKCQKRSPWYSVPGIWESEGLFFKRSHLYPKLLSNVSRSMVTDSAYRIKMLEGSNINSLVYSFYNSLTLSLSELEGRYYGGGVLELTPNEFKSIIIPYTEISEKKFSKFKDNFQNKKSIEDISFELDKEILMKKHGIDLASIKQLQAIKRKLTNRRLNKVRLS